MSMTAAERAEHQLSLCLDHIVALIGDGFREEAKSVIVANEARAANRAALAMREAVLSICREWSANGFLQARLVARDVRDLPLPDPPPDPRDATISRLSAELEAARDRFKCKARPSLPAGPQDCDWPECGCDPAANRVLAHLQECGFTILDEATLGVTLTEAREALEPFAEVAEWAERNSIDLTTYDMILRGPSGGMAGHLQVQAPEFIAARAVLAKPAKGK